jgi:hypothetical protein
MSFSLVPPSHITEAHPVLFQRPQWDNILNNHPEKGWITNPNKIWIPSEEAERNVPKGLPRPEIAKLMASYRPAVRPAMESQRPDLLYNVFFSGGNLEYIRKSIVAQVYQISKFRISPPDMLSLIPVVSSTFEDYAQHTNEDLLPIPTILSHIRQEISRLDALVCNKVVPEIISNAETLASTSQRILTNETDPLPRPINTSIRGTIELRPIEKVLS